MKCEHDIDDREEAVRHNFLCPICLKAENEKLKRQQVHLRVIAEDRLKMLTKPGYLSGCGVGYIESALQEQEQDNAQI